MSYFGYLLCALTVAFDCVDADLLCRKLTLYGVETNPFFGFSVLKTLKINKSTNRPWWPSVVEGVSNSSRHSLEAPGSNPCSGLQY